MLAGIGIKLKPESRFDNAFFPLFRIYCDVPAGAGVGLIFTCNYAFQFGTGETGIALYRQHQTAVCGHTGKRVTFNRAGCLSGGINKICTGKLAAIACAVKGMEVMRGVENLIIYGHRIVNYSAAAVGEFI